MRLLRGAEEEFFGRVKGEARVERKHAIRGRKVLLLVLGVARRSSRRVADEKGDAAIGRRAHLLLQQRQHARGGLAKLALVEREEGVQRHARLGGDVGHAPRHLVELRVPAGHALLVREHHQMKALAR
jgi:hypothetical protein